MKCNHILITAHIQPSKSAITHLYSDHIFGRNDVDGFETPEACFLLVVFYITGQLVQVIFQQLKCARIGNALSLSDGSTAQLCVIWK